MDTLNFEQIGEKLKKIRLSKNLTQEYIANAAPDLHSEDRSY